MKAEKKKKKKQRAAKTAFNAMQRKETSLDSGGNISPVWRQ